MGSLGSGSVKVMLGRVIVMGIGFACAPVMGRMFSPNEYGVASLVETMVYWIAGFMSLGYAQAIPLAAETGDVRGLTRLSVLLNVALLAVMCMLVPVCGKYAAQWFGEPELERFMWFVPALFFLSSLSDVIQYAFSQQGRFGALSLLLVLSMGLAKPLQIGLGWFFGGTGLMLLVGALLSGVLATAVAGMALVPLLIGGDGGTAAMWAAARRHRQFPRVQLWNAVLQATAFSAPALAIGTLFGSLVVGWFNMGRKLILIPVWVLAISLGQVFYPQAAAEWRRDGSSRESIMGTFRIVSMLCVFPTVCLCFLGPLLFAVFLGEKWFEAGVYAQLLAPYIIVTTFTGPMKWMFLVGNRAGRFLAYNVLAAVGGPLALAGGAWVASWAVDWPIWLNGPRMGVFFYALASLLIEGNLVKDAVRLGGVRTADVAGVVTREIAVSAALLLPAGLVFWAGGPRLVAVGLTVIATLAQFVILYRREEAVRRWVWKAIGLVWRGAVAS